MSHLINGKPIRTRAGRKDRPSRASNQDYLDRLEDRSKKISTTALVGQDGIYFDRYDDVETEEDHIIPRKSRTEQLHINLFPSHVLETMEIKSKQLDKGLYKEKGVIEVASNPDKPTGSWWTTASREELNKITAKPELPPIPKVRMIEVVDNKATLFSDRNLLRKGIPLSMAPIEQSSQQLRRRTSITKTLQYNIDESVPFNEVEEKGTKTRVNLEDFE